jgi:hypothetical protein
MIIYHILFEALICFFAHTGYILAENITRHVLSCYLWFILDFTDLMVLMLSCHLKF